VAGSLLRLTHLRHARNQGPSCRLTRRQYSKYGQLAGNRTSDRRHLATATVHRPEVPNFKLFVLARVSDSGHFVMLARMEKTLQLSAVRPVDDSQRGPSMEAMFCAQRRQLDAVGDRSAGEPRGEPMSLGSVFKSAHSPHSTRSERFVLDQFANARGSRRRRAGSQSSAVFAFFLSPKKPKKVPALAEKRGPAPSARCESTSNTDAQK